MTIFDGLTPPYSTIVADPPWPYDTAPLAYQREAGKASFLPYSTMTLGELHRAVRGGNPTGLVGMWEQGIRYPTATDWDRLGVVLCHPFSICGNLAGTDRNWWTWARRAHSQKPEAFMDLVEAVAPGPYVELFARAPRLGWDSWGHGYETERAS